jgi:hypothetical protein
VVGVQQQQDQYREFYIQWIKNKPIPELEGKNIAIIAMGNSQLDYHKMITHSKKFDEVWAINAMIGVLKRIDRAFVMDPVSRFFDTDDAGEYDSYDEGNPSYS